MSRIDIDNNIMCYIDTNHNLYYAENDFINPKWIHIGPPCSSCAISNGKIIALPYIEKPESVLTKQGGSIELTSYFYFTNNYKSNIWKRIDSPIKSLLKTPFATNTTVFSTIMNIDIDNDNIIIYCSFGKSPFDNMEFALLHTKDDLMLNDSPMWRIIDNRYITSISISKSMIIVTLPNTSLSFGKLSDILAITPEYTKIVTDSFLSYPLNSNSFYNWNLYSDKIYTSYFNIDINMDSSVSMLFINKLSNNWSFSTGVNNITFGDGNNIENAKVSNNKILCYSLDNKIYFANTTIISDVINLKEISFNSNNLSELLDPLIIYSNGYSLNSIIAKISIRFNISPLVVKISGGVILMFLLILILFLIFKKIKKTNSKIKDYNDDD